MKDDTRDFIQGCAGIILILLVFTVFMLIIIGFPAYGIIQIINAIKG